MRARPYDRTERGAEVAFYQKPVRAAGCVLWRRASTEDGLEIALVHRPKYDDWSHPKGKLKRGESALAGAVREVAEETGMDCRPGAPCPPPPTTPTAAPRQSVTGPPKPSPAPSPPTPR